MNTEIQVDLRNICYMNDKDNLSPKVEDAIRVIQEFVANVKNESVDADPKPATPPVRVVTEDTEMETKDLK